VRIGERLQVVIVYEYFEFSEQLSAVVNRKTRYKQYFSSVQLDKIFESMLVILDILF
jgi:hypothetical protein